LTQCAKIASSLNGEKLEISTDRLFRTFKDNIETQGADFESFIKKVESVRKKHIYILVAEKKGYISYNLKLIRDLIVGVQNQVKQNKYPDPCGVKLLKEPQKFVERGEKVMSIRIPSEVWHQKINQFKSSFSIQKKPLIIKEDKVVYE
jgi:thymidine phosphorylase